MYKYAKSHIRVKFYVVTFLFDTWKWFIPTLILLFLCIDIEFEIILIPSESRRAIDGTNNIITSLSYSYIAAVVFHVVVNYIPHKKRMKQLTPYVEGRINDITNSLRLCTDSIFPSSVLTNKSLSESEFTTQFNNKNLLTTSPSTFGKTIIQFLDEKKKDINMQLELLLACSDLLTKEQFDYVVKVRQSYFMRNVIFPKDDPQYETNSNQAEIGKNIYNLYEMTKAIQNHN